MKLNGLDADQMEYDEVKEMVTVLLAESAEEYGFEPKESIHKQFEKLSKFYYMKSKEESEEFDESREYIYSSGDLKSKQAKALINGEPADGKLEIKIENPEFVAMKARLKVLQSAKSRFAGVLDKCKDVLNQFENKKKNAASEYEDCKQIHEEFAEKVVGALKVLEDLRILALLVCLFILKTYLFACCFIGCHCGLLSYQQRKLNPYFLCTGIKCEGWNPAA